jgi:hypothetical protein
MKHCLLPVDWPTRTGKQCLSEESTSFAMRRKQWHTRNSSCQEDLPHPKQAWDRKRDL